MVLCDNKTIVTATPVKLFLMCTQLQTVPTTAFVSNLPTFPDECGQFI